MGTRPEFDYQAQEPRKQSRPPPDSCSPASVIDRYGDLLGVGALAILAVIIAWTGLNQNRWLALFGPLLALVLPGYALSVAVLPNLLRVERLLCALGLSLVVDILGGLLLYVTPWGLHSVSWAILLGGTTLPGCFVAGVRRDIVPPNSFLEWPKLDRKSVLYFELALAIALAAVLAASFDAQQKDTGFTQLWAVPDVTNEVSTIRIGISNQENEFVSYALTVESNRQRIREWHDIDLGPDEVWTTRLILPAAPDFPVQVLLFRAEEPEKSYREASISPVSWQVPSPLPARVP